MNLCKGAHKSFQDDQEALPGQVLTHGSKSTPDTIGGLSTGKTRATPRRHWTVLRQLKGILDLSHLPAPSDCDHDRIRQPSAISKSAAVWSEV